MQPHRRQPTRLPSPWDSPGKNTGVGCHFLLQLVKVKLLSRVQLLATPWTAVHQAPPSMGFSRLLGCHYPNVKIRQKHYRKRKLQTSIFMNIDVKVSQQSVNESNTTMCKKNSTTWSVGIYVSYASLVQPLKVNSCKLSYQQAKKENHKIVSIVQKKCLTKSKTFMIKSLLKLRNNGGTTSTW